MKINAFLSKFYLTFNSNLLLYIKIFKKIKNYTYFQHNIKNSKTEHNNLV